MMDEIREKIGMQNKHHVYCPYCGTDNENEIEKVENFKVVVSHPLIIRFSREFPETKIPFWMFWGIKFPKGVREGSIKCKKCGEDFYVGLFPYDSDDPKNSKDLNYYLKLAKGKTEKLEKKFLLEDALDRFGDFLHIKHYPVACLLFISIPSILFWILPIIVLGGFSKISHDYGFFFLFVLFVLMLVSLKYYCTEFKKVFDFKKLPFSLSKQYTNSNLKRENEEALKGCILGHPFQKITAPTLCGLIAVGIFLIWQINYTINIANTFYETQYSGFPVTYTSYILSVAVVPFWAMIWFIIGNIIWIFIATTALLGLLTRNIPLQINPLKEMGGTEVFGKIILLSLYPFAIVGAGIPLMLMWGSTQEFYVLLIGILLVLLFVFSLAFGFFYPLWPIHNKLKAIKEKEQDEILNKISISTIKNKKEMNFKEIMYTNLLLSVLNKISSIYEWPFKVDTLIKALIAMVTPLISFAIKIIFNIK